MKEPSLFDFPKYQINKKIRLIELFGGIGSQAMALRDLGADFENYRLVEIDKHAVKVYNVIHNTSFTPADIKDIKIIKQVLMAIFSQLNIKGVTPWNEKK